MKIVNIQKQIDHCKGLCIEIGGPSPNGYAFLQKLGFTLPKNILITNISNPVILNPFGHNPNKYNVDAIIDINSLPYQKNEVDLILTSSLPYKLHKVLFNNASKVLRRKGLLVIENQLTDDINTALQLGFNGLLDQKIESKYYSQIYQLTE